jgi:hypothetical protein
METITGQACLKSLRILHRTIEAPISRRSRTLHEQPHRDENKNMVDKESEYSIQNPTIGKRLLWPCIQFPGGGRFFRREHYGAS